MQRLEIRVTVNVTDSTNRDDLYRQMAKCLSEITNEHRENEGIVRVVNVGLISNFIPVQLKP
jgi:hypothetical protein